MNTDSHSQTVAFIWSVADLLRGDFKQSQYGRVILLFTLLLRLECVLALTKAAVLAANDLVYQVVQRVASIDLSPVRISNSGMRVIFEELIHKFAESSNKTAGEPFTPYGIVHLTSSLVLTGQDKTLRPHPIATDYDPTAGTGGFLYESDRYIQQVSDQVTVSLHGQELNPESYPICQADMLIEGQDAGQIKLGNTLSDDQLPLERFDFTLADPPFDAEWNKAQKQVTGEHKQKSYVGRFGPTLLSVSNGPLLYLIHLISKMSSHKDGGSRIGIILNRSPLLVEAEQGLRRFATDFAFSFPITAAAVVFSRSANGHEHWKIEEIGQTYAGWQHTLVMMAPALTTESTS